MNIIQLNKHIFGDCVIRDRNFLGVFGPKQFQRQELTDRDLKERIQNPIHAPRLTELARNCKNVLIVTDDNTRLTPLFRILPPVLAEIEDAGIPRERTTILIGLGTHRPMNKKELLEKFGRDISEKYNIINHEWNDPSQLVSLGPCALGFEVIINRLVQEADLIISIGNIVPHATAGFSGGGKTIMPGICGEKTIADTHWGALKYEMREILGNPDNDVRDTIVSICRKIGLQMIVNAILYEDGKLYDLVAGDVDSAHKQGIEISKEVYGVKVPSKTDIVIAEAYPTDIDLRQAIKAICAADIVCRDEGVIILPAECPEGVSPQFPDFARVGFKDPDQLFQLVEEGKFSQKLLAYTLVAIGRIISKRIRAILVSPHINESQARQLGFYWAKDLDTSVNMALEMTNSDASVMVLKQAGEILPLIKQ